METRLYLASRYTEKETMSKYADDLKAMYFTVTSRWLLETHKPTIALGEVPQSLHTFVSMQDFEDIDRSDGLLVNTFEPEGKRGGHHVETGYAMAKGLKVFVLGEPENSFHFLPGVVRVKDWEEAKQELLAWKYDRERKAAKEINWFRVSGGTVADPLGYNSLGTKY